MHGEFASTLLHELDIAVLTRTAPGLYAFCGKAPHFYTQLFPSDDPESPCTTPWDHSPMMEFFLQEAEEFFATKDSGKVHSGIWQEGDFNHSNFALISTAMYVCGTPVLLVRCLAEDYADRTTILQKARENLLEQRELRGTLKFYQQKSSLDSLTSLYNRATFMDILALQLQEEKTQGFDLALLMLDIDDFKQINDNFGHLAGDTVLRELGEILRNSLREVDIASRYGGEEFIILAPYTSQKQAGALAQKLRQSIARHTFADLPAITASLGYATYVRGESAETFIKRADMALYDAKHAGKNTVCGR